MLLAQKIWLLGIRENLKTHKTRSISTTTENVTIGHETHMPSARLMAAIKFSLCTKETVLSFLIRSTNAMHHVKVTVRQG